MKATKITNKIGYEVKSYRWLASAILCALGIVLIVLVEAKKAYVEEVAEDKSDVSVALMPSEHIIDDESWFLFQDDDTPTTATTASVWANAAEWPTVVPLQVQEVCVASSETPVVDALTKVEIALAIVERLLDKILQIVLVIVGIFSAIKGVKKSLIDEDSDIDPKNNDV